MAKASELTYEAMAKGVTRAKTTPLPMLRNHFRSDPPVEAKARRAPLPMQASGFLRFSWRRFVCATSRASARTPPLVATFTDAQCPSQTVLHAAGSTQLPNMSARRTRKPASVTSGSQLRWYSMSRFVYRLNQLAPRAHCNPSQQSLPGKVPRHHSLCPMVISVSPLACRFWRNTFPTPHFLHLLALIQLSLRRTHILTLALLALTMARGSAFSSVQNSFLRHCSLFEVFSSAALPRWPLVFHLRQPQRAYAFTYRCGQ